MEKDKSILHKTMDIVEELNQANLSDLEKFGGDILSERAMRLSIYSVYLSKEIGKRYKDKVKKEYVLGMTEIEAYKEAKRSGIKVPVEDAKKESKLVTRKLKDDFDEADIRYNRLMVVKRTIDNLVSVIQSRLSYLKSERTQTNTYDEANTKETQD